MPVHKTILSLYLQSDLSIQVKPQSLKHNPKTNKMQKEGDEIIPLVNPSKILNKLCCFKITQPLELTHDL